MSAQSSAKGGGGGKTQSALFLLYLEAVAIRGERSSARSIQVRQLRVPAGIIICTTRPFGADAAAALMTRPYHDDGKIRVHVRIESAIASAAESKQTLLGTG